MKSIASVCESALMFGLQVSSFEVSSGVREEGLVEGGGDREAIGNFCKCKLYNINIFI